MGAGADQATDPGDDTALGLQLHQGHGLGNGSSQASGNAADPATSSTFPHGGGETWLHLCHAQTLVQMPTGSFLISLTACLPWSSDILQALSPKLSAMSGAC